MKLKRSGIMFTCLYSCVFHLNIANSFEADSLLLALRRYKGSEGTFNKFMHVMVASLWVPSEK